MTLEDAKQMVGAWVRTQHLHGGAGGAGKIGGQLVGVRGNKVLVKIAGHKEPTERDPGDVHIWKSRTVQDGKVAIVPASNGAASVPAKATKIDPPLPTKPRSTTDLFSEFEDARAEVDQWAGLEKSCKEDLEQAKMGYDMANQRLIDLRKELNQRINF